MRERARLDVCICTYRRPRLLKCLLERLIIQETEDLFSYSIIVVDNDRAETAREVVAGCSTAPSVSVRYDVEPRQNIALARNKAVANATGEFIAFIDDDELPPANWLVTMFRAITANAVAGVLGPVVPQFEPGTPRWVILGGFYDRPRHRTGFIMPWTEGRTGNVLFKRSILDGMGEPFRPEFGSGGEDRNFFMRLIESGHVFMWCDEAVVHEVVPPARCGRKFMLRRALLRGKMSLNHKAFRARGVVVSLLAVPVYSLALPFVLLGGQHQFMKYLVRLFDHAGKLMALVGLNLVKEPYVTE